MDTGSVAVLIAGRVMKQAGELLASPYAAG